MTIAIIIPARYGSTRFPGKPLAMIAGKTMLSRVVDVARQAQQEVLQQYPQITIGVATEDQRIADHAQEIGVPCLITSDQCATGSDRVLEAVDQLDENIDFVLGLQGDAPLTPPQALIQMIETIKNNEDIDVITPVVKLRWEDLDRLRAHKTTTPFSGTTAIINQQGRALWFSKNILPAIRKEEALRRDSPFSPVYQHIGLYGYRVEVLRRFVSCPQGIYEQMEGLEQLRLLENGISIQTVTIDVEAGVVQAGIDSPEDIKRAEAILQQKGAA